MKTLNTLITICCFSLLLACLERKSTKSIELPPIKERVNILLAEATKWDSSAYLYSVTVPVSSDNSSWKITAAFNSLAKPYNSLILTFSSSESIEANILEYTNPVLQRDPILERGLDKSGLNTF